MNETGVGSPSFLLIWPTWLPAASIFFFFFFSDLLWCRFAQAGCLFGGEVPETLLHQGAVDTSQVGRIHSDDTPDLLKTGAFLEQIVGISPEQNTHTLRTQVCLMATRDSVSGAQWGAHVVDDSLRKAKSKASYSSRGRLRRG